MKYVKYWLKLTELPLSRLSRQNCEMLLAEHNQGEVNWYPTTKNSENGFGILWLCQGVGYEMRFVAEFKDKLISCYKQNWHSEIESDEIYKWYYSFKNSFVAENYLSFITTNRFRDTLTRFRLRACGLRSHKIWFLTEASKTVAARCVGIYWKMRYMYYFSVQFPYKYVRNMTSQNL